MLQVETIECVSLLIPDRLGDYTADKLIGQGTAYAVIKGFDRFTGSAYAIKVMSVADLKNREMVRMVERELAFLSRLRHPHIVEFREFIRQGDLYFSVMEHCSGGTLSSWISDARLLDNGTMQRLFYEVALAIQYLHSQGISHNGIDPDKILLSATGSAKLSDFSHASDRRLFSKVDPPDNLFYAAPEVLCHRSDQTQKSDIWALGILLCLMATRAFPFRGADKDNVTRQIRGGRLQYPRMMDRKVEALVRRMTKTNPNNRPTIDDVLGDSYFDEVREIQPGASKDLFVPEPEFDCGCW
jgi:serine/threonine protein kinase